MDQMKEFAELQRKWSPPVELSRSRPREVRWTAAGFGLLALAGLMIVGAVAAGAGLGRMAVRQADEVRLLRERGAEADGVVTRLWRSPDKDRARWVAYQFTFQGRTYEGRAGVPARIWSKLEEGAPFPVRLLPSNPELNHPSGWDRERIPLWLPYLLAACLAAGGVVLVYVGRQQRWLLAEGRPAPAIVTRHGRRTQQGIAYDYEFPLLSGGIAKGRINDSKAAPQVGAIVCVLYDPDNPRQNAPYPLSLVKL